MAEAKTQPTKVPFKRFLETVDDARRDDCRRLVDMMQAATGAPPVIWGDSLVGFGQYRYVYASGRTGDWPVVGFSPRKSDLTLYLTSGFEGSEAILARLGKHKASKACLYIKRLSDVDQDALQDLIAKNVEETLKRQDAASR